MRSIWAMPRFFRQGVRPSDCPALLRQLLVRRDERFLDVVRRAVFGNPRSPYLALLRSVGCEWGDLVVLVRAEGIEGAMRQLADRGVYVTGVELKARRPIVRGSFTLHPRPRDFVNPLIAPHFFVPTSGSTGGSSLIGRVLAERREFALLLGAGLVAHGARNPVSVSWRVAPLSMFDFEALGCRTIGWFNPVSYASETTRLGQLFIVAMAAAAGRRLPVLRAMPLDQPGRMLDWLRRRLREHAEIVVVGYTGAIVRVATTAAERGLSLSGVIWNPIGEPYTAERHAAITASGGRSMPQYGANECGSMAMACPHAEQPGELHVGTHRVAFVRRGPDRAGDDGGALAITTLDPYTPTIMFNTDLGDDADISTRDCGCVFGQIGLTTRIMNVRPFGRLSSEGITFEAVDIVAILERELPARFGGHATDYQIAEEHSADGRSRLILRVHPRVRIDDTHAVRDFLLHAIGRGGVADRHISRVLGEADAIQVARQAPIATAVGKILPFVPSRTRRSGDS
jgi:phenylacetate-coenzyme A ligase PaaK-like adenylate-forming protein